MDTGFAATAAPDAVRALASTPPQARAPRTDRRAVLLVFLVAFAAYLPGFWWGAPHATARERDAPWGVDDVTAMESLGKVHRALTGRPDNHPGYPLLHQLVVSAAQAPYIAYLVVRGRLEPGPVEYPWGFADPVTALRMLTRIGHLLTVLMAAALIAATFDAARVLWDSRTAVLAALFAGTCYPMFYYARTGNVDVPVLLFTALALNAFARCLALGVTPRRMIALGTAVGLAVATKEPAFASFLAIPAVLPFAPLASGAGQPAWRSVAFWRWGCIAAAAALLTYAAGSGLLLAPGWWLSHFEFVRTRIDALASGEIAYLVPHPFTLEGHAALAAEIFDGLVTGMTAPGLALAFFGAGWAVYRRPRHALFLLPAITYLIVLFWSARIVQLRYLLPPMLTLSFFAAFAVTQVLALRRPVLRAAVITAAIGSIAIGVQRGIALTYEMITDSRYAAGEWFAAHAAPDARVEFFGSRQKLPPLPEGVVSARAYLYRGAAVRIDLGPAAAAAVEQGWRERQPDFVLMIPDHSSAAGQQDSGVTPEGISDRLLDGSLGYRLAAEFGTATVPWWRRRPPLDYPTVNPPIRIFVPARSAL